MPYLISIAIGPVQEFIASARRSRDLWFGSWLLSELSKAAAMKLVELNGNNIESLIFPAPANVSELDPFSELGVANKILGKLTSNLSDSVNAIRKAVEDRLQGLTTQAYSQLNANDFHLDTARMQVTDLLEFYWAAVEVTENTNGSIQDYHLARSKVEALLAARKATRAFDRVSWGSDCPKSSLDGQRESVIPELQYPHPNASRADREAKAQKLWQLYNVRVGERLCGVGLLKRHGLRDETQTFFSTSHVAALPLMDRFSKVNPTEHKKAFALLIERLRTLGVNERDLGKTPGQTEHPVFGKRDGHLLFDNRLSDFISIAENLRQARRALCEFLKQTVNL
jgi:CRISPR-associated protein Cmr2